MLKNYLKIALRNLIGNKVFSAINILGLALGIAGCILVFLFIQSEFTFDSFNNNESQIYRVASELKTSSGVLKHATTSAAVAIAMRSEYPALKVERILLVDHAILMSIGTKKFYESNVIYAEDGLLQMFTFPLLEGNTFTALRSPDAILLTEAMAKKYFGNEDPIGKTFTIDNSKKVKVTGVLKNLPPNSAVKCDFVISYLTLSQQERKSLDDWRWVTSLYTFVKIPRKTEAVEVNAGFNSMIKEYGGSRLAKSKYLFLQPLNSIHLHSHLEDEMVPPGSLSYIYLLSTVGLLILLIACINFISLSTATSARRSKEVGIRKVLGADRRKLIYQFFTESFLYTSIALVAAIALAELVLPFFNSFVSRDLSMRLLGNLPLDIFLLVTLFSVSLLTGGYPALFISSFTPIKTLSGSLKLEVSRSSLRTFLVGGQFIVAILLISSAMIIIKQMDFIRNWNPGFSKKDVVIVPLFGVNINNNLGVFEDEVRSLPGVSDATEMSSDLNSWYSSYTFHHIEGILETEHFHLETIFAGYRTLTTLGLQLKEGRWFSKAISSDSSESFILNEAAVESFGWKDGLGKHLSGAGIKNGIVIGIVKNFNYSSLHHQIDPLVIRLSRKHAHYAFIKLRKNSKLTGVTSIRKVWSDVYPGLPFRYSFLSNDLDKEYGSDAKFEDTAVSFSFVAIFITCAGLLGLISYVVERRRKEITVRKVLGASVAEIVLLLSREFAVLVLIANLIAWPIAYYVMHNWLNDFAYRINISWWIFILSGGIAFLIALTTVSFQAVKAATANPVKNLRYE